MKTEFKIIRGEVEEVQTKLNLLAQRKKRKMSIEALVLDGMFIIVMIKITARV